MHLGICMMAHSRPNNYIIYSVSMYVAKTIIRNFSIPLAGFGTMIWLAPSSILGSYAIGRSCILHLVRNYRALRNRVFYCLDTTCTVVNTVRFLVNPRWGADIQLDFYQGELTPFRFNFLDDIRYVRDNIHEFNSFLQFCARNLTLGEVITQARNPLPPVNPPLLRNVVGDVVWAETLLLNTQRAQLEIPELTYTPGIFEGYTLTQSIAGGLPVNNYRGMRVSAELVIALANGVLFERVSSLAVNSSRSVTRLLDPYEGLFEDPFTWVYKFGLSSTPNLITIVSCYWVVKKLLHATYNHNYVERQRYRYNLCYLERTLLSLGYPDVVVAGIIASAHNNSLTKTLTAAPAVDSAIAYYNHEFNRVSVNEDDDNLGEQSTTARDNQLAMTQVRSVLQQYVISFVRLNPTCPSLPNA